MQNCGEPTPSPQTGADSLDDVIFKGLDAGYARLDFDCGDEELSKWFWRKALDDHKAHRSRVLVAIRPTERRVLAFCSLHILATDIKFVPAERRPGIVSFPSKQNTFLSLQIGHFATDKRYQRRGVGMRLMFEVFTRFNCIATNAGVQALTVDSKDTKAALGFYSKMQFKRCDSRDPKLEKKIIALNLEKKFIIGIDTVRDILSINIPESDRCAECQATASNGHVPPAEDHPSL